MTINKYCQALAELRAKSAHELKEVGDQWRTPDLLFWGVNALFGPLVLDLFADDSNAKCPAWYTAEDNALTQDWSARVTELGGAAFGNPPYSRSQYHEKQAITGMTHIMKYAADMREKGGRYVFLIKAAPSETWWPEDADHIVFIRGRIGFDLPEWFVPADEKQKPTSAFFAGAIVVFDKSWRGERFSYIHRSELEAKGRAFMALAQFAMRNVTEQPATIDNQHSISESELPLSQVEILRDSGIQVWACVRAAFGDKEAYSFAESKFGHTWAADSVDHPEFTPVHADVIATAKSLITGKVAQEALLSWLNQEAFDSDDVRADTLKRMSEVAKEFTDESGMEIRTFIGLVSSLEKSKWFNCRLIRTHIRDHLSATETPEARIWPLEVGLAFNQVNGCADLDATQQNKLKAHIHQLWLERKPTSEIIAAAGGMVEIMQREVA